MQRFDYFVILAEMRTGSNLLEATLEQVEEIHCHGEAFNPDHLGRPGARRLLGMTMQERIRDPLALLERIRSAPGLNGFRFFFDHDPRVVDSFLNDPRCAKIVLTRNPVDSYVSLKIAYNTNRWRLSDVRDRIEWKPPFKPAEFEAFLRDRQAFQLRILRALQVTGQTAFYLDYEDALDVDVVNGLLAFLGVGARVASLAPGMIRQNPEPPEDKVRNPADMRAALKEIDWANLSRTPNFEPRRGPGVPRHVAARGAGLVFMPILPNCDGPLRDWLAGLGDEPGLVEGFSQKTLRAWLRRNPRHRFFTVLRHPVLRANECLAAVLRRDDLADIRAALRAHHDVALPEEDARDAPIAPDRWREMLLAFLRFVKANLNGQTAIRQDLLWASQVGVIQGFAQFAPPDLVCREDELHRNLVQLARSVGVKPGEPPARLEQKAPHPVETVADEEIEDAARAAWPRDYLVLGFDRWSP